ncbi:glycoside hydrolase family 172 protein [Maribellus sediminis]|uniref:glycoside hydrolase family 172 protein n=1 Tax=Maribellus sediminis TaxID=2696285 RepID=UPI00142FE5AA|nr:glycoside hydrolase family 172 protein [Maribellus sediminis]
MKKNLTTVFAVIFLSCFSGLIQAQTHDGIGNNMNNLYRMSKAKTRSISAENFTGEKGKGGMAINGTHQSAARDLGQGWKVSPAISIQAESTFVLADVEGQGAIQHIWMTPTGNWRNLIVRMYWDGEDEPSVEVPLGDFFCSGWGKSKQISSLAVCVNPHNGFNSYWTMPFRKGYKVTVENLSLKDVTLFFQIDYCLTEVEDDAAYFHAQFRRSNPHPYKEDFLMIDNINGRGQYVGAYMSWGTNNSGWWGEGEIKFFIDDDAQFPTICGTGTEDYFCGAYCFVEDNEYKDFSTPYTGFYALTPDKLWNSQMRFGLYRWHVTDPIRFEKNLRVTIQALGWREDGRYLPLQGEDLSSVVFWYQAEPHSAFPELPGKDELTVY